MRWIKNLFLFFLVFLPTNFIFADGNISSTNYTAKLLNDGSSINFGYFSVNSNKNVTVDSDELTGYIWGENIGWISLNCSNNNSCNSGNFKVSNDGNGNLSGYAWGENAGWINFGPFSNSATLGISISGGDFDGYAWSENFGWIQFDCNVSGACVNTSWRPSTSGSGGGGVTPPGGGGGGDVFTPIEYDSGGGNNGDGGDENSLDEDENDDENVDEELDLGDFDPIDIFPEDPIEEVEIKDNCENPTTILGVIWCTVIETYDYTVDSFNLAFDEISQIIKRPDNNFIIKLIGIVGILFGTVFSVLPKIFATPLSFTEIGLLPYRLWSALMTAFGLKKRARPWGTVYDAITKQPLDPVIVSLQDLEGNEVQSSITDMDGRYGFLVSPGTYRLFPKKTHYSFPSIKLVGKTRDELYLDLYFGNVFEVKDDSDVIIKNIPMDPIGFDWNEFAKRDQKLMKFYSRRDVVLTKIADWMFSFGFTVSLLAIVSVQNTYNIIIFILYLILLFLRENGIKTKNFGKVLDLQGNPVSFAIIKVFNASANVLISKKVANKYGQYYCLIQQGDYFVEIDQKLPDETYKTVFKSGIIKAKDGYIKENFKINLE